jgi:epoxyqueuosine reductase
MITENAFRRATMVEIPKAKHDAAGWISESIRRYTESGENTLPLESGSEPAWEAPLVGFSRGDDPLYQRFKEDIGPFFWTPAEIFAKTFPDAKAASDELTVIAWILPQTEQTRLDNSREKTLPSERWVFSRKYGEDFNIKLRNHVVRVLGEAGCKAVAPMNSPLFKLEKSERYGFASSWSERHAAYVSGLGTFGLCDGLITPKGKAMRCGSVVARIAVPPSVRPYDDHHAYCLYYFDGSCGKCIKRCPADAISKEGGHDKEKCFNYVHIEVEKYIHSRYGFKTSPCGLCQTGVPCEAKIPVPERTG